MLYLLLIVKLNNFPIDIIAYLNTIGPISFSSSLLSIPFSNRSLFVTLNRYTLSKTSSGGFFHHSYAGRPRTIFSL